MTEMTFRFGGTSTPSAGYTISIAGALAAQAGAPGGGNVHPLQSGAVIGVGVIAVAGGPPLPPSGSVVAPSGSTSPPLLAPELLPPSPSVNPSLALPHA